jgi:hypothetical protein
VSARVQERRVSQDSGQHTGSRRNHNHARIFNDSENGSQPERRKINKKSGDKNE